MLAQVHFRSLLQMQKPGLAAPAESRYEISVAEPHGLQAARVHVLPTMGSVEPESVSGSGGQASGGSGNR